MHEVHALCPGLLEASDLLLDEGVESLLWDEEGGREALGILDDPPNVIVAETSRASMASIDARNCSSKMRVMAAAPVSCTPPSDNSSSSPCCMCMCMCMCARSPPSMPPVAVAMADDAAVTASMVSTVPSRLCRNRSAKAVVLSRHSRFKASRLRPSSITTSPSLPLLLLLAVRGFPSALHHHHGFDGLAQGRALGGGVWT